MNDALVQTYSIKVLIMAQKHRLRFNFWLDIAKPLEEGIADNIEILKNKRSFSSAIRDGLRLIVDLRNGKLDVLFELFPFVKLEILDLMRDVKSDDSDDNSSEDFKAQFQRLEQLILSQGIKQGSPVINQIGSMKSMQSPIFNDSDDLDLVVTKDTSSGGNSAQNFLRSMQALSGVQLIDEQPSGIKSLSSKQFAVPTFEDD